MDPFERTGEDLLLVEAFARLELGRPRKARDWFAEHGVLDLASLFPELFDGGDISLGTDGFGDTVPDVLQQQANVRWHLAALARLSLERERAGAPRPGAEPHDGWDPAWAEAALRVPDGSVLWLGARTDDEAVITPEMQRYARYEDVPRLAPLSEYDLAGITATAFTERWWPAAHAAWQRIQRAAIPVLWVPSAEPFEHRPRAASRNDGRRRTDWHGLFELERVLLEPFVRVAAARDLHIGRVPPAESPSPDESRGGRWYGTLVVHEERAWRSLLAPMYLQLLEAFGASPRVGREPPSVASAASRS